MRTRTALLLVGGLLLLAGCTVVSNFAEFKFGTDAGPEPGKAADGGYIGECSSTFEDNCNNGRDDDCDEHLDCDDPDCANDSHCCKPNEIPEVSCSGDVDNDCDGKIDCDDPDCSASKACCSPSGPEVGAAACSDGMDNDCDGVKDCDESTCASQVNCCAESVEENDASACSDGLDNDCDGKQDCRDPDCAKVSTCCTQLEQAESSCGDAKDNDCDGDADCRDSDCESRPVCLQCSAVTVSENICDNLRDDDCDKDRDCWDDDCANALSCCVKIGAEQGDVACSDGQDNDCDGQLDCGDTECDKSLACCVSTGSESGEAACTDGKDNDCDGLVDCMDMEGCSTSSNCCVPSGDETGAVRCNDGIDNDCNQHIDCQDSGCDSSGTCCVHSGEESATPNDGKDNDCNGTVDIALPDTLSPSAGQPVPGNQVSLTVMPEVIANATLECSTRRLSQLNAPVFSACPIDNSQPGVIKPHADEGGDEKSNGAWVTDVRWRFPNGARSEAFSFRYYIHHTLYSAERCTSTVSDSRWFDLAKTRLTDSKVFHPDDKADTWLTGPFVHVTYELPPANKITGVNFFQDESQQTVDMWSLRKRFVLDPENKYLLITRTYKSTRSNSCSVAALSYHIKSSKSTDHCQAVVLNRSGAGVCMVSNTTGTPMLIHESGDTVADKIGWPRANKFMWRQLLETKGAGLKSKQGGKVRELFPPGYRFDESLNYRNFMPKCTTTPCISNGVYLPDRALFP